MICKKLIDPDNGDMWYLFYDRASDENPRMVMTERQVKRFVQEFRDSEGFEEDTDE